MSTFKLLAVAALLLGATFACTKPEPPSANVVAPAVPALPDLAKPETWDRKDRPFAAKGRVRVTKSQHGTPKDKGCEPTPDCQCWESYALALAGPRPTDQAWVSGSTDGEIEPINGCTGEGKYPQGEAEVEGTLKDGVFVLSKPPKYAR